MSAVTLVMRPPQAGSGEAVKNQDRSPFLMTKRKNHHFLCMISAENLKNETAWNFSVAIKIKSSILTEMRRQTDL